jgi:FMN phosphatase YigB (HAD superfamily)
LAFDLYGTLVNPIAIAGELGQILGDSDGREAARLWRLKQLEYSFRLTAMGRYEDFGWVRSRALDFALGARLPEGQIRRLAELHDHLELTSNAFDCVGADAAGMRTAWVNRSAAPFETIGQPPDLTVPALDRLPAVLAG